MIYALCDFSDQSDKLVQSIKSHDSRHHCKLIISEFFNEFRDEEIVSISIKGIVDNCKNTFIDNETKFEFDNDFEWIVRASQRFKLKKISHNEAYFQLIRMYAYLKSLLKMNNIKVLFFGTSSPHHLYNQLLAIAAKNLGINVFVNYAHDVLGDNKIVLINYFSRKPVLIDIEDKIDRNYEKQKVQLYLDQHYGLNKSAAPLWLKRNKFKKNLTILRYIFEFIISFLYLKRPKSDLNTLGIALPHNYYREFYVRRKIILGWVRQSIYKYYYKKNSVDFVNLDSLKFPYVIFLASVQPEATSIPDAFKLSDVNLAMQKLIKDFGGKYEIYFQEHPGNFEFLSVFDRQLLGSSCDDFRSISDLDYYLQNNVNLIYPNIENTSLLIDNASAVFSINGSSLIQGTLFNKPTFNFGKFCVDLELGFVEADYDLNLIDQIKNSGVVRAINVEKIVDEFTKIRCSAFPNFTGASSGRKDLTLKSDAYVEVLNSVPHIG